MQNINNIKNNVTSMFKKKLWCEKDLEAKRKLRYYKEVINPTQRKKLISHELHSETGRWTVPTTSSSSSSFYNVNNYLY